MTVPRFHHAGVLLQDGRGLIVSGYRTQSGGILPITIPDNSTDIYVP